MSWQKFNTSSKHHYQWQDLGFVALKINNGMSFEILGLPFCQVLSMAQLCHYLIFCWIPLNFTETKMPDCYFYNLFYNDPILENEIWGNVHCWFSGKKVFLWLDMWKNACFHFACMWPCFVVSCGNHPVTMRTESWPCLRLLI